MIVKTAHTARGSVRYLESGGGRAVVLLHGFPLNADQWLPQLHHVPAGWRLVAPDLRGFRTPADAAPELDVTIDDFADDVLALMSHLDIQRAVIAGLSMGGYVALALAARAPERVAGMVLANTRASADTEAGRAARTKMIDQLGREGVRFVGREMIPKLLGRTSQERQPDLVDALEQLVSTNSAQGLAAAVRAMRDRPDRTSWLPALDCPVTIVTGAEDVLIPAVDAVGMQRQLRDAELVTIPSVGHLSNLEDVAGFNAALFGLLARVEGRHTL